MTSNYLEIKYPREGYKEPVKAPIHYHSLSIKSNGEDSKKAREEYDKIKKMPVINVCSCGYEWENKFAKYQEGCYPYMENTCSGCAEKAREEQNRKAQQEARKKELASFNDSLPPRFRNKLTTVKNKELKNCSCGIIWGDFGTGKTWECYTLIQELYVAGEIKSWDLKTEMDIIISLRDYQNQERIIKNYKDLDILVIDETGKSNETDYNKALLFSILNHRYEWEKKTILICNAKSKDEVKLLLPTAILDRFRECVIEMKGKSLRYS